MPLTDVFLRKLKPDTKARKYTDGNGLYVNVSTTGVISWRFDYMFQKKRKTLTIGKYPEIRIVQARHALAEAKQMLANGVDPCAAKKEADAEAEAESYTFERVGREWFERMNGRLEARYRTLKKSRMEKGLFPFIGRISVKDLKPNDILQAVRRTESTGHFITAHRLLGIASEICDYARVCGYCELNPAANLSRALSPVPKNHHAAITDPEAFGHLLVDIGGYQGDIATRYALNILPYVFLRSSELRCGSWGEINFDAKVWTIPSDRMKMGREHIVPLSCQVLKMLKELRELHLSEDLLFPGPASNSRPITDVTLLNALRRLGYARGEMTVHGFRASASTMLNSKGYNPDVIEAQLAHKEANLVRAAYNRHQYIPERTRMMQEWADYLDTLRQNAQA